MDEDKATPMMNLPEEVSKSARMQGLQGGGYRPLTPGRPYGRRHWNKNQKNGKREDKTCSVVFTPGMSALAASEEADLALVSSTELPEPPECKVCRAGATAPRPRGDRTVADTGIKIRKPGKGKIKPVQSYSRQIQPKYSHTTTSYL